MVSASAALVLVAGISLAYAYVDFDSFNDLTGPNSENESLLEADRDIDVDVEDRFDINNDYDTDVISGENEVEENTFVGDIENGDVDVAISTIGDNFFDGFGFVLPDLSLEDINVNAGNQITGPNSLNRNDIFANLDADINLENRINVDNDLDLDVVTGNNEIEQNTEVGDVQFGDVDVRADIGPGVDLNNAFGTIDLGGLTNGEVNADFSNSTTGPKSENINRLEAETDLDLNLENKVDIDNDVDLDVESGNNEISENTLVGDIETGDVTVDLMAN
jgi:hypothetical protein